MDCGPGTLHGMAQHGIDWAGLTHVLISHYHMDHVGDLAALPFAMKQAAAPSRSAPLTLIGPLGFRDFLERLATALGPHVLEPGFDVIVHELEPQTTYREDSGAFAVGCVPTPHTDESVAYRLDGDWGAVGYTGDTGPSSDVARFLAGCDVLIAECALSDPPEMDRHLSPALVAQLADIAEPGLLVLTHVYPDQSPEDAAARVSERYGGRVVAARDGMRIGIGPAGPSVDPNPEVG
jgi:ribonuclease BN (tRNA processing enzyme)